jgi:O-acetyl-ADP-ribose deacetylase (regulator of RNase III)/CheY-like chemotaxis protein
MSVQTKIGKTTLRLVTGDIADQDTEAVVTAAHWRLNKGNGTDGTIHSKGGPRIYEECQRIGGCPIGEAVITTGGNLKARHVIHAVGPVWSGGDEQEPELLSSAYRRSLEVAVKNGLRSISFPSISTGAFVYPIRKAAPVALKTIVDFLTTGQHNLDEVRMVLYTREDSNAYNIFVQALEQLLSVKLTEAPAEPDRKDAIQHSPPPRSKRSILYVEDHAVFADTVVRQFLSQHEVIVVPGLAAARLALKTNSFDLLLVDFDLSDGKGDTLVRQLRQCGNRVVVIGVSSHEAGNEALLRAGAAAVCSKMDFDRIQAVIDCVMSECA